MVFLGPGGVGGNLGSLAELPQLLCKGVPAFNMTPTCAWLLGLYKLEVCGRLAGMVFLSYDLSGRRVQLQEASQG